MLLVAVVISGYSTTTVNSQFGSRAAALNAAAANGVDLGGVALGRDSMIIQPVAIPTAPLPNRMPIRYTVAKGDTLDSVAETFGVTLREITWSNPGLHLPLKTGLALEIPPVAGVVVTIKRFDTLTNLATRYGVDPSTILGFNDLRDSSLMPGTRLVIPIDPEVGPNLSTGLPADPLHPEAFACPIPGAKIIQKFGPTSFALEPPYGGYLHFHTGIDLLADYGTPIDAAAGGMVTAVGYAGDFGIRVQITDSYGLVEIYAHMEAVSVAIGEPVQQGQKVGLVGSTGLSIGSHLHFQLEIGGVPADPGQPIGCVV